MNGLGRIRVMIVDDHAIVREGLALMISLQSDMEVACQAGTLAEGLDLHPRHRPDVCLVDLRLPDGSGVDLIREIRRQQPRSNFVVLTTFDGEDHIHGAITAGARAYLLKNTPRERFIEVIRAAAAGQSLISEAVASRLVARMSSAELSGRELDILRLMARGHANKMIAAELGIGEGTVRTHMVRLFRKLGVNDRTSAVMMAMKRGWVDPP
jgi:two-component system, NarL family, response regulator